MVGMPRQGERSPFPISVCIKEERNPENVARIGSTKSLSPLFCVPESVSVVVYSLCAASLGGDLQRPDTFYLQLARPVLQDCRLPDQHALVLQ
jgi:hypothetical protein